MDSVTITVLVLSAILLIYLYMVYIGIIKKKNKVLEAFASVDVQLKKRYDLIPNIIVIAKAFMEHERNLMTEVTKLRAQAMEIKSDFKNIGKKLSLDTELADKMSKLLVAVENYPQLKSDKTMLLTMQTYNEVEEHIAAARRFYNSAVNDLNNAVEIFPSSLIAAMLNIKAKDFFSAKSDERISPKGF
ncbi:LemA family protein [bacterium]|nr:LemA family protein [bacterium]